MARSNEGDDQHRDRLSDAGDHPRPKIGRPLASVDADQVYKLARIGLTQDEIADFFGCGRATISQRFRRQFRLGKAASKTRLRLWQMRRAKAGSDAMLIHLGKCMLGQNDKAGAEDDLPAEFARDDEGRELEP